MYKVHNPKFLDNMMVFFVGGRRGLLAALLHHHHKLNPILGINLVSIRLSIAHKKRREREKKRTVQQPIIRVSTPHRDAITLNKVGVLKLPFA